MTNPLLSKLRIPGETYRLPSQGLFYDNQELDPSVKNGEVEVYPMTALDEITLSTPDKLLSGKAVLEIFGRCIPQVLKPGELLAKDVDFLLVCLRLVSFGQSMDVTYTHSCENAKNHTYSVDLQKILNQSKQIDPTTIDAEFTTTLQNGQVVTLKPLTYNNIVELYQTTALTKTDNITENEAKVLVIDTLASVIRNVDGTSDPIHIKEWLTNLRLGSKKELEKAAQRLSQWGVDFMSSHKCKDCVSDMHIQVSANPVNFFT